MVPVNGRPVCYGQFSKCTDPAGALHQLLFYWQLLAEFTWSGADVYSMGHVSINVIE